MEARFARQVSELSEAAFEAEQPKAKTDGEDSTERTAAPEGDTEPTHEDLQRMSQESRARQAKQEKRTWAQRLATTLADYPEAAILTAWAMLETSLRRKTPDDIADYPGVIPIPRLADALVRTGELSQHDTEVIARLRVLRNEVAHAGAAPSAASAIEYAATVDRLLNKLE